ncbi:olfactory receptor 10J4-like [Colossoma macropomum]|uniref:olfactory receptor 10J4-like n=1 Tax=Colossoma macropomum TaxID=42526 RepID=UPI0018654E59|nr:olfactory receptor 10J4-like [Colossoma macropomum]
MTYLTLEGHVELEKYRYVYFIACLIVYLLTICFNSVVIFIICKNKCLHEPMYIFIAALLCNSLFGTTALYPKLLSDLLSERQGASYEDCLFQSFFIHIYAAAEFALLSAMAYDRYVSICKPLQYAALVKMSTVKKLLFCCWFVPSCETGVGMILKYQLKLCDFKINRIYCNTGAIVKLSCGDTSVKTFYGMVIFCVAVFPPVIFVILSYVGILEVCLRSSKDCRRKALQTCFPHLFIFTSFTVTSCFEVINNRLEGKMPHIVTMIMSVENFVIPPLINPIIYGLKLQEIWNSIKKLIWKRKMHHFSPMTHGG